VDVPAVTAWSLLGSHDWNRMVTRFVGHYEVGVFDVRSGSPRPTLLAPVLKALAEGRKPTAVGLGQPGWWRRVARSTAERPVGPEYDLALGVTPPDDTQPLLIVGRETPFTRLLVGACEARGLYYRRAPRVDEALLRKVSPWAVVDGRDWAGVCEGSAQPRRNADAHYSLHGFFPPEALVRTCASLDLPCAVFTAIADFDEIDERLLEVGGSRLLLAGTDRVFTPWERARYAARVLDALDYGLHVTVNPEEWWDETYGPDLIDAVLDGLLDGLAGAHAFVPHERLTLPQFVRGLAEVAEAEPGLVVERAAPTVRYAPSAMEARWSRTPLLPPAETTLERFVRESRGARRVGRTGVERRKDDTRLQAAE
jgi:dTDP-4-dehydrorhamnose reductase